MKKSVSQELGKKRKQIDFPNSDALFGGYSRCDGIDPDSDYLTTLISGLLRSVALFSDAQKRLIYEQLIKSGFTP